MHHGVVVQQPQFFTSLLSLKMVITRLMLLYSLNFYLLPQYFADIEALKSRLLKELLLGAQNSQSLFRLFHQHSR